VWDSLKKHYQGIQSSSLTDLFSADAQRFEHFSIDAAGLLLDYSRNHLTQETLTHWQALAGERQLTRKIKAMFDGESVNKTEGRPALHVALRNLTKTPIYVNDKDIMPDVDGAWQQMDTIVNKVHAGEWVGYTGKSIRHIVNIGIGGSDFGPKLVYQALLPFTTKKLDFHFVSNIDFFDIENTLENIDPETTLFVMVSKSFTTKETLTNADLAKDWLAKSGCKERDMHRHLVAVTANVERAVSYGVDKAHILPMWDWVGGRYSLWSAVGLSSALALGMDGFKRLLSGAQTMDQHFHTAPLAKNMPFILGMLSVWYINFFGAQSRAVVPYSQQLAFLPDYLQQLHMESQGKHISNSDQRVSYETGAVIWGGVGTNSQHSFHQWFMQGNQLSPIDFILPIKDAKGRMQKEVIANCLAQSEALAEGYSGANSSISAEESLHREIKGNYPHNIIMMDQLNPETLGALLALYEHKVYVQSIIWDINAFDQWGVERGKVLANEISEKMASGDLGSKSSIVSRGLMKHIFEELLV
jgi:glucose-6-phosphate isomerase